LAAGIARFMPYSIAGITGMTKYFRDIASILPHRMNLKKKESIT
jgi:hypothetical protein